MESVKRGYEQDNVFRLNQSFAPASLTEGGSVTITPFVADLAAEHRRALLRNAGDSRRAKAARRPTRAGRLTIRIRPVGTNDSPLLADIFVRLSPASRFARFLYVKTTLTTTELRHLTDIDHHSHEALIAVTRLRGEPVGVARFIRNRSDQTSADIAIAVVDEWQDRGVGSMLVARLTARALRENVAHFTALTSSGNLRARRLLAKTGDVSVVDREGGTVSYRVTLAAPAVPMQGYREPCAFAGGA